MKAIFLWAQGKNKASSQKGKIPYGDENK